MRLLVAVALAFAPTFAFAADPPKDFFFQPKDRVVFLGDSITEQYQYSTYVELYLTTRFPNANIFFLNAGISGDTANGGAGRFPSHVLAEKPTKVTINFGMNDGGYGKFNPASNKVFVERSAAMLEMAKKAGVKVALISPNAVDPRVKSNGAEYVETQKQFYAPLKDLAETREVAYVDQYGITRAAQDKMAQDDPKAAKAKPYYDGFHTSPPGAMLMAHAILTGLKAPALVSDVVINGKTEKIEAKNCTVDGVKAGADGSLMFTRTDEALPLPVQKDWLPMLPYMNEMKDLNWYGLTITDLTGDATYAVKVDGVEVGKFTGKQLAAGVNIGNATSGPIFEHANKVFQAINAKNGVVHKRFREVVMYQTGPTPAWLGDVAKTIAERKQKELDERMVTIAAAQADVYKLAQPTPHKFEILLAK